MLTIIEVLETVISFPLMLLSMQASQQETLSVTAVPRRDNAPLLQAHPMMITIGLGLIGLGIIVFATRSAMGI